MNPILIFTFGAISSSTLATSPWTVERRHIEAVSAADARQTPPTLISFTIAMIRSSLYSIVVFAQGSALFPNGTNSEQTRGRDLGNGPTRLFN